MGFLKDFKAEYNKQASHQKSLVPGSEEARKHARFQGTIALLVGLAFVLGCGISFYFTGLIPKIALAFAIALPPLGIYSLITGKSLVKK